MTRRTPRFVPPSALLPLLLLCACAHPGGLGAGPPVLEIAGDTVWSGEVRVEGIVHVRTGVTLSIRPGTRVLFADRRFGTADEHEGFFAPGIRVEGRIIAEGTEEDPILFASAREPASPGSWDKILFSFSTGNRFSHCRFEGARYAFHAHFSHIEVRDCLFRGNVEGVRLGTSRVAIRESVFTRNELRGINFRECRNEIRGNLVYENGDGIFLHSKDSASVIRGNAVYANRGYNLRLGDLHAEDIDVSGNWWGTADEAQARATIYDGARLPGIGRAGIVPLLPRPPVAAGEIVGVFVAHRLPVAGATVRAYRSVERGLWTGDFAAETRTDDNGAFRLAVPPGRYYVTGRAESAAGTLFAFPGRNPVRVPLRGTAEIGLPSVVMPPRVAAAASRSSRPVLRVRATRDGRPEPGAAVTLYRPGSPDFRGPGEASAVAGQDGVARFSLPPGEYVPVARKRTAGAAIGMVEEGGLFGVYPHSPVTLAAGAEVSVEVPLFEKVGLLAGETERTPEAKPAETPAEGTADLDGAPAAGHVVYFYRPPETIGRPVARSSTVGGDGRFTVLLPGPGEYLAFLRKGIPGLPAGTEEERIGPVPVRAEGGRIVPSPIRFAGPGRKGER
ncbi:MAG: hypothetical protein Kow00128_16630 [Deltaproteobacteria bacterium]